MQDNTIEVLPSNETAVAVREKSSALPMTVGELHDSLEFVRTVMQKEMREGEDFGKIPGCGDKPTLLQPGAQKLCMVFRLDVAVKSEIMRDLGNGHREYEFAVTVHAQNGRSWDGVGTCSTLEGKYRYRNKLEVLPDGIPADYKQNKEAYKVQGLAARKLNEKWCWCRVSREEHDNPADYWNTVRKMAFKRAHVHAAIIATNTSMLWTQDMEDISSTSAEESEPTIQPKLVTQPTLRSTSSSPPPELKSTAWMEELQKLAKDKLVQLLSQTPSTKSAALNVFIKEGLILDTEDLKDVSPSLLFPLPEQGTKEEQKERIRDRQKLIMEEIESERKKSGNAPPIEVPDDIKVPRDPEAKWKAILVPTWSKHSKQYKTLGDLPKNLLWWWCIKWQPKPWKGDDGKERPPNEKDVQLREVLDFVAGEYEFTDEGEDDTELNGNK